MPAQNHGSHTVTCTAMGTLRKTCSELATWVQQAQTWGPETKLSCQFRAVLLTHMHAVQDWILSLHGRHLGSAW